MPNIPMMPKPPAVFVITVVGGSPDSGDHLVTLSGLRPCILTSEGNVLDCVNGQDFQAPAVFRAKHQEDGRWQLFGGYKSFTVNEAAEGEDKELSTYSMFETEAQLFLAQLW